MLTLITCCNSRFFGAALTLIESAQRHSAQSIQEIRVYDLGLHSWQRHVLNSLKLVQVVDFAPEATRLFPNFYHAKSFAWKQLIWMDQLKLPNCSLYLDSGIEILRDLGPTEETIETDGILLVDDKNWRTKDLTHAACAHAMEASEEELNTYMLCSGIVGIKPGGPYSAMFHDAFKYSQQEECLIGSSLEPPQKHRQDQSILSILSARYQCPKQPLNIYAQWQWQLVPTSPETVLHVHRKRKGIRNHIPQLKDGLSPFRRNGNRLLMKLLNLRKSSKLRNGYR